LFDNLNDTDDVSCDLPKCSRRAVDSSGRCYHPGAALESGACDSPRSSRCSHVASTSQRKSRDHRPRRGRSPRRRGNDPNTPEAPAAKAFSGLK